MSIEFHLGHCIKFLAEMESNSIDAIVTDPPYGLSDHDSADVVECLTAWMAGEPYVVRKKGGFMSATWDSWVPGPEVWRECYRVLKPGGYLLSFSSTRTDDLMSIAIRLAGFRKHPFLAWIFGQGFGKATNLSKMIDKQAGAEREVVGTRKGKGGENLNTLSRPSGNDSKSAKGMGAYGKGAKQIDIDIPITAPATPEAQQWDGWYYGLQSLKPAVEPILMFQKPADRSMTANVLRWGTGAIHIDACRIGEEQTVTRVSGGKGFGRNFRDDNWQPPANGYSIVNAGRWPSNVAHDGSEEVLQGFPVTSSGTGAVKRATAKGHKANAYGVENRPEGTPNIEYGDTGSAARFMYCAKSSPSDRNAGLDGIRTVKYNVPENGGALCKDAIMALVVSLERVTLGSDATWLIGESGASITGLCQSDTLSTTLTAISRITTSQILNLLMPLLTSAFTQAVNLETANGGSPAASVANLSKWIQITTNGNLVLAPGVDLVVSRMLSTISDDANWNQLTNIHSTVKPTSLMRWLVRLVTPPGGTIVDPFVGSGSTLVAAEIEGFNAIGIDIDAEYLAIAKARVASVQLPLLALANG